MANTTQDLRVVHSLANQMAPQQDGKNIAGRVYYTGQLCVKDGNGRLDNPGDPTLAVLGVFRGCQYDAAAQTALAADAEEYTVQPGEYFHLKNSGANPIGAAAKPGTKVYAEDNQTVGTLSTAGSLCGKFMGFDQGRLKIAVGVSYQ